MKITGGILNSRNIETEEFKNVKPTLSKIREAVFSTLASFGKTDGKFADLFAGSGIISFEAVSRGFDVFTFEIHPKSAAVIRQNAQKLNVKINLSVCDTLRKLKKSEEKFDVIYVDPPYHGNLYDKTLNLIKDNNLCANGGIIVLEYPDDVLPCFEGFKILKTKNYGKKNLSYVSPEVSE